MKRRPARTVWTVPVAAAVLATAAWALQDNTPGDVGSAVDPEAAGAAAEVPLEIPAEAKAMPNPLAGDEAALRRGKLLFGSQCTMCHGLAGAGDGDLAERLAIAMPDLSAKRTQQSRSDGEWFYIISNGHGRMPAEKRLDESARWSLVLAVRSMGR